MKNKAIKIGIILCLLISAERLYNLYQQMLPVAKVGECVNFNVGDDVYICEVLKNTKKSEILHCLVITSQGVTEDTVEYTNKELREFGVVKVDCQ